MADMLGPGAAALENLTISALSASGAKTPTLGACALDNEDVPELREKEDNVVIPRKKLKKRKRPSTAVSGMSKKGNKEKKGKRGKKKVKKKKEEPEIEEKPPSPPQPWRPADTAPDYQLLSVTSSIVELKENVDVVLDHLIQDESVRNYTSEFVRMYESTATAHVEKRDCCIKADRLRDKNEEIEATIGDLTGTLAEKTQERESHAKAHETLIMETNMRRAREVNMIDLIGSLRKELSRYNPQNLPSAAGDEDAGSTALVSRLNAQKEALMDELVSYKARLADTYKALEAVEIEQAQTKDTMVMLEDKLHTTENDCKLATAQQTVLEEELREEKAVNVENKDHIAQLSALLEEAGNSINNMKRAVDQQKNAFNSLQKDHDAVNRQLNDLVRNNNGLQDKFNVLKTHFDDRSRQFDTVTDQLLKCTKNNNKLEEKFRGIQKRLEKDLQGRLKLQEEKKVLMAGQKKYDNLLAECRGQLVGRDGDIQMLKVKAQDLEGKFRRSEFTISELNTSLGMQSAARKRVEENYRNAKDEKNKLEREVKELWRQKKKCQDDQAVLALELELKDEEIQKKQSEVVRCKKTLANMQVQFQQHVNSYDTLMSQRNSLSKNVRELEGKLTLTNSDLKMSTTCIEQLKENLTAQENKIQNLIGSLNKASMAKKELAGKVNKLKDREIQLMAEIKEMNRKEMDYVKQIKNLESERDKTKLQLKKVGYEKSIIGSQLVRRNDEISELRSVNDTMQRQALLADSHYQQREDDIRLLRTEIKHYRRREEMLNNIAPTMDTRRELYHLNISLVRESLKRSALEAEAANPVNIHRWRRLHTQDPTRIELMKKVNALQKRILKQNGEKVKHEMQMREAERLFTTLNKALCTFPGRETQVELIKTKRSLGEQIRSSKALMAELRVTAADSCYTKLELNKIKKDLNNFKSLYACAKKVLNSNGIPFDGKQGLGSQQREVNSIKSMTSTVEWGSRNNVQTAA